VKYDLILKGGQIVYPGECVKPGSIAVIGDKIARLLPAETNESATRVIDCRDRWILPGLIDPHTHIGFGDKENDWLTETRSALIGGVTSLLSFHRDNDLAVSTPNWRQAALDRASCDFGFHFGVTKTQDIESLAVNAAQFGVTSIKVYLMYKGAYGASKGFTEVDDALLFRALQAGAKLPGGVVSVHCENVEVIPVFREPLKNANRNDLAAWNEQSPGFLETENVFRVCYFGEKADCPVNIVHMSSAESLELVRGLRRPGRPPINIETCAHYLSLSDDMGLGLEGKVNPPLRSQADVDGLWEGVRNGEITTIGSDHVARKHATKGPDLWTASAGFPGLATLLPVLIEEGYHKRGVPIETIAAATSRNVANLYSIPNKGKISPGYDADLTIVDPTATRTVDHVDLASFSDYSPFQGRDLCGQPTATVLRGRLVMESGAIVGEIKGTGRYLERNIKGQHQ